ncbi:hypothetical protein [Pikeienuella piscinae]|nr:hypothetical protein [Pikeienuella piscinae]
MSKNSTTTDQSERFEETARELGVDLDEAKLKEALRKIAPDKPEKEKDE